MTNILLLAVGDGYIDKLFKYYSKIPFDYNVTLYTSDKSKVDRIIKENDITNCNVYDYGSSKFSYFDKFKLTINLANKLEETILYVDVGRIEEITDDIWQMDLSNIKNISFNSTWGGISSANDLINFQSEYLESNYFNNILDTFDVDLKEVPVFLERVFIVPFKESMKTVLNELEIVRTIFEQNSKTKQNVYSGLGNGEGLGMGYVLTKLKEPYNNFDTYKRKINNII